jgi:hypothetical protein
MNNTYTGNRDGDSGKARPGLLEFVKTVEQITDGALWNNGTYVKRDMRGKPGTMSVHSTGRAVDLSYRKMGKKGRRNGREIGKWLCTCWRRILRRWVLNAFWIITRSLGGVATGGTVTSGCVIRLKLLGVRLWAIGYTWSWLPVWRIVQRW